MEAQSSPTRWMSALFSAAACGGSGAADGVFLSGLLVSGLLLVAGARPLVAQAGVVTEADPVIEAMDAYEGHWRSEKKTGPGGAFHFEYELEWLDAGRTIAEMLITQVMADGSTGVVFDGFKGREPDGSGLYYWAASPSGRGSHGTVFLEGSQLITRYDGWTSDGSTVQIRDVFMPVDGDAFVSHTYLRTTADAEWRKIGEDRWRRAGVTSSGAAAEATAAVEGVGGSPEAVLYAMAALSATTAPGGGGPDAYAALLADDFTRWTAGDTSAVGRAAWVEGVAEWWEAGWRVADRSVRDLEMDVRGNHAFVRRVVREDYLGPDGERTGLGPATALAEVWERRQGRWLLLRVTTTSLDDG